MAIFFKRQLNGLKFQPDKSPLILKGEGYVVCAFALWRLKALVEALLGGAPQGPRHCWHCQSLTTLLRILSCFLCHAYQSICIFFHSPATGLVRLARSSAYGRSWSCLCRGFSVCLLRCTKGPSLCELNKMSPKLACFVTVVLCQLSLHRTVNSICA